MYLENVKKLIKDITDSNIKLVKEDEKTFQIIDKYIKERFVSEWTIKKIPKFVYRAWNPIIETWEEYETELDKAFEKYKKEVEQLVVYKKTSRDINRQREILISRYGLSDGKMLSYEELAEKYNCTPSYLKEIISDTLRILKRQLVNLISTEVESF